jgi:(1->4)-alpha-D-glucan 1-alpha-D-glucosylmutase
LAPLSDAGRIWPGAGAYQGAIVTTGYTVDDAQKTNGASELPLANLFQHMPVAIRRATFKGGASRAQRHR